MKRRQKQWLAVALVAILALPGCIVRSVHSWIREDSVDFEEDLLGGWTGSAEEGDAVAMTFVRGSDNNYIVQYSDKDSHGIFEGRLAKFGMEYFMDFKPKDSGQGADGMLLFPMHSVARMEIGAGQLTIWLLNYDELASAAKLDRLGELKYTWEGNDLVITSNTSELQQFLLGLSRNSRFYSEPIKLSRRK